MSTDLSAALREVENGVLLLIEVTAGAKEARFPDGYDPWRARVGARVRAPPEDGRANREVCAVLAGHFGLGAEAVSIVSGHRSRQKTVALQGIGRSEVLHRLEGVVA